MLQVLIAGAHIQRVGEGCAIRPPALAKTRTTKTRADTQDDQSPPTTAILLARGQTRVVRA